MSFQSFVSDPAAVRDFGEWYAELYLTNPSGVEEIVRVSRRGTPSPLSATVIGSDTIPANTGYDKRILETPSFKQSLWTGSRIGGHSIPSFGDMLLNNRDRGLDYLRPKLGYKWRDRRIKVFCFDNRNMAGTASKIIDAKLGDPRFSLNDVTVTILGREAAFNQPISSRMYRGTGYMLELNGDRTVSFGTPAAAITTGNMTVEGWLWINAAWNQNRKYWGWFGGTTWPWVVYVNTDGTMRFSATIGGGEEILATTAALAVGKPYHFAFVVSGRDVTFYLWDDDAQTLTVEPHANFFSSATRQGNTGCTYVVRAGSDATAQPWSDEFRVWNVARTQAELDAARFGEISVIPASLVHYPRFNDGTGTTVVDSSATAANGTISGGGTSTWLWSMEGGPELAGTPKPDLWGQRFGVFPVLVDPITHAYQVAGGGSVEDIDTYEGGNPHIMDATAASMRAFITTTPAAGHALPYFARGLFKLSASPTFPVLATAKGYNGGALGYVSTAADIVRDIVTRRGPKLVDPTDLDTSSFTAFESDDDSIVGVYLRQPSPSNTIAAVLDFVVGSVGGWWGYVRGATTLHVERFEGADVNADYAFDQTDIVSLDEAPGAAIVYEVVVKFRPSDLALSEDQVAAAIKGTLSWQQWLLDWQEVRATDPDVREDNPGDASVPIVVETGLYERADAQALADFLLALLKDRKEGWNVTLRATGAQVAVGDTVSLSFTTQDGDTALGLDGTGRYIAIEVDDKAQQGKFTLSLHG